MTRSFLVLLFLMMVLQSTAQDKRFSLNTDYNIPGGKMAWMYKSYPGIQANFSWLETDRRRKKITSLGVTLGYTKFVPSADTLYFLYTINDYLDYGTAVYSDYHLIQLAGEAGFDFRVTKETYLKLSIELGYYYAIYESSIKDGYIDDNESVVEGKGAIIPKIGYVFNLHDKFSIVPYTKFNFFFSLGSSDPTSANYNSNLGSYDYYYSIGCSFQINF